MLAVALALVLAVVSCSGKEQPAANATVDVKTALSKKRAMRHIKTSPPVSLKVNYTPSKADEIPVAVEVTPTHDVDDMEVTWSLPDRVDILEGSRKAGVPSSGLRKGEVTYIRTVLKVDGAGPAQATVTARIKLGGKWYGVAKAIELRPEKTPGPAYKVVPGSKGRSGYTEMPMERVK